MTRVAFVANLVGHWLIGLAGMSPLRAVSDNVDSVNSKRLDADTAFVLPMHHESRTD